MRQFWMGKGGAVVKNMLGGRLSVALAQLAGAGVGSGAVAPEDTAWAADMLSPPATIGLVGLGASMSSSMPETLSVATAATEAILVPVLLGNSMPVDTAAVG